MRSLKTQKYADYYLFLEEIISHFNDFQIMKLQNEVLEVKKDRILKLSDSNTYESFCVVKRSPEIEFTLIYDKYQKEWFKRFDSVFNYMMIRGSYKNVEIVMRKEQINDEDVVFRNDNIPCSLNFKKKILEELKEYIRPQKIYLKISEDNEQIEDSNKEVEDNETIGTYENDDEYRYINHTKLFKLEGITDDDFKIKLEEINKQRTD